jgi:hypothetical protein
MSKGEGWYIERFEDRRQAFAVRRAAHTYYFAETEAEAASFIARHYALAATKRERKEVE